MSTFTHPGERRGRAGSAAVTAAALLALPFAVGGLPRVHAAEMAPAASTSVQVLKDSYSPAVITVRAGDTVTWTNVDTTPGNGHTVTSSGRGPLKSSSFGQGGTYSYTFSTAGSYPYYCAIHPDMTGTVTVN
jgi:plastocyanin